jgi:hypothetical protein
MRAPGYASVMATVLSHPSPCETVRVYKRNPFMYSPTVFELQAKAFTLRLISPSPEGISLEV